MAMVNRWCPWWLSVQDFGGGNLGFLGKPELESLPAELQPLLRHLAAADGVEDRAQQPMLDRAQAASDRTTWGFAQQKHDPGNVLHHNAHVRVPLPPPIEYSPPPLHHGPKLQPTPLDADGFPEVRAPPAAKL